MTNSPHPVGDTARAWRSLLARARRAEQQVRDLKAELARRDEDTE